MRTPVLFLNAAKRNEDKVLLSRKLGKIKSSDILDTTSVAAIQH